jgi:hypothetical protein
VRSCPSRGGGQFTVSGRSGFGRGSGGSYSWSRCVRPIDRHRRVPLVFPCGLARRRTSTSSPARASRARGTFPSASAGRLLGESSESPGPCYAPRPGCRPRSSRGPRARAANEARAHTTRVPLRRTNRRRGVVGRPPVHTRSWRVRYDGDVNAGARLDDREAIKEWAQPIR